MKLRHVSKLCATECSSVLLLDADVVVVNSLDYGRFVDGVDIAVAEDHRGVNTVRTTDLPCLGRLSLLRLHSRVLVLALLTHVFDFDCAVQGVVGYNCAHNNSQLLTFLDHAWGKRFEPPPPDRKHQHEQNAIRELLPASGLVSNIIARDHQCSLQCYGLDSRTAFTYHNAGCQFGNARNPKVCQQKLWRALQYAGSNTSQRAAIVDSGRRLRPAKHRANPL